jgi:hypothetical protein
LSKDSFIILQDELIKEKVFIYIWLIIFT